MGEFSGKRIGDPSFAKDRGGGDIDLVDDGGLLRHAEPALHADLRFAHHIWAEHHLRRRRCCPVLRSRRRQRARNTDNPRGVRQVTKSLVVSRCHSVGISFSLCGVNRRIVEQVSCAFVCRGEEEKIELEGIKKPLGT